MSESETLVIRSTRVVVPEGEREAAVVVRENRIADIADYGARLDATADVDLGDLALLPGLVDTHVHVNEPGRVEREGFATATRAAAAGGITTICDMPLNSVPVTTTVEALRAKASAASGQCAVDVAFWAGAVPGNLPDLSPLSEAGVAGFQCLLTDTGNPEFPPLDRVSLRSALKTLAQTGTPMVVHAEATADLGVPAGPSYDAFLASRPAVAERRAIETVVAAAAATGARAHILNLSAAECAALIDAARASGVALSAETCPHYLFFAAEEITDDATQFKSCPPVRYAANREALWRVLEAGTIQGVVSGHSPCTPQEKGGNFSTARAGIASLQVALPAVWTVARQRGCGLADIARWMAAFPAALAGLPGKGRIAVGCDADLVAFDPSASVTVNAMDLRHRHPVTPYHGRTLTGRVSRVWLRGADVDPDGKPRGRLLRRGGGDIWAT